MSHVAPQQATNLADKKSEDLRALWRKTFGSSPPAGAKREFVALLLAYGLQEVRHGGLSRALTKQLRKYESHEQTGKKPSLPTQSTQSDLTLGARLIRSWGGQTHEVTVIDKGFAYRGQKFGSLTEVAELITGVHWSGPRFFGLTPSSKAANSEPREKLP